MYNEHWPSYSNRPRNTNLNKKETSKTKAPPPEFEKTLLKMNNLVT